MLPALLAYKFSATLDLSSGSKILPSFGFDAGGTYDVTISSFDSPTQYCFVLKPLESGVRPAVSCSPDLPDSYVIDKTTSHISGVVRTAAVYYPIVTSNASGFGLIEAVFRNPTTHQDVRWGRIIPAKIGVLCVLLTIVVFWLANWNRYYMVQIRIHNCLTGVFVSTLFYLIVRAIELSHLETHDSGVGLTTLRAIGGVMAEIIFYATILLISKGWCIVRDALALSEILSSLIYSWTFIVCKFLLPVFESASGGWVLSVVTGISMVLFLRDLVQGSNDATLHIIAHLLAIRNAGINPRTTPIFQKHLLYRRFQLILITGSAELLLEICLAEILQLAFFAREVLDDCMILVMMALLAIVFRLRPAGAVAYGRMSDEDGIQEILLSDLDHIDVGNLEGGMDWVDGMALPAPPEIVRERQTVQASADLVLASPDGTATIQATVVRSDV
jgi:hypothetical protein